MKEYPAYFSPLTVFQFNNLAQFLTLACGEVDNYDIDLNQFAYILATVKHETANTFQPIHEYGYGIGKEYGRKDPTTGQIYYGRGYVQLTWKANYEKMGSALNIDIVNNPALAMNPVYAVQILVFGMEQGMFTGKKLDDYIQDINPDYVNARRIVNGLDQAAMIANYAQKFADILNAANESFPTPDTISATLPVVTPTPMPVVGNSRSASFWTNFLTILSTLV